MLDENKMLIFSSELGMAWVFLGYALGKSLGKPMPPLAHYTLPMIDHSVNSLRNGEINPIGVGPK
jgi:hypothetical protein